jgi:tRNA-specific 2-thiouridylase
MAEKKPIKAIALLSGGLDSSIAVKIILDQGIECIAVKFNSPFCNCDHEGVCFSKKVADDLGIEYKSFTKGDEYLEVVRNARHGYGKGINPCIDCRIFMFKEAKKYMEEIGASFLITGEVLGQRPMSQHRAAMELIEKESGCEGILLRPLSAGHFKPTIAEEKGWVDREKLLTIEGRSRKKQLDLAKEFNIQDFSCAGGGCLLTEKVFGAKLRDFFRYNGKATGKDIQILKNGRHFRVGDNKIISGRNKAENKNLKLFKYPEDIMMQVPVIGSPLTLVQGPVTEDILKLAASITALYSDSSDEQTAVEYGTDKFDKTITVPQAVKKDIDMYNLAVNKELSPR